MGGGRRGRKLTGSNTVQTHSRLPSCLLQDTYTQFEFETNRPQFLPIADLMLKDDGNTEYWGCVLMALWPWVALLLLLEPITSLTRGSFCFLSHRRLDVGAVQFKTACKTIDSCRSCSEILAHHPGSKSGRYLIGTSMCIPPPFAKACTMLPYFRSA